MARVSSHILDAVSGAHAAGIRCQLYCLHKTGKILIFDVIAGDDGRIVETVTIDDGNRGAEFELVFHAAEYFTVQCVKPESPLTTIVLRFTMLDDSRQYHLPVILSPHAYSTWWSG